MLKIGITGGIGSGKSYVCEVFKHLGIPVYSADNAAKVLYTKSSAVKSKIIDLFGEEVYSHEGINRSKLASKVFGNPDLLKRLNSIIHPAVEADFNDWCQTYTDQKYILKEAAILFESGSYKLLDKVIVVTAPKLLRIKRVCERDNVTEEEVNKRMSNQWPADKIIPLADFIIENDGKQLILPQILHIDKIISV